MYVAQCYAGYPMPLKAGKFEVCGVRATLASVAAAARLTLFDDETIAPGVRNGNILPSDAYLTNKTAFLDELTAANTIGTVDVQFPEPIKMRFGVSVSDSSNIVGGSLMLYVR